MSRQAWSSFDEDQPAIPRAANIHLCGRTHTLGLEERRKRERENRKNAILKAARRLFFEKGFKPVTVESIAKKAELSKGSIYLYYNSKEEIYTQILLSDIDKFHDRIADLLQNPSSAAETLMRLANIYVDFFLNDRELFRILMTFSPNEELIQTQPARQFFLNDEGDEWLYKEKNLDHIPISNPYRIVPKSSPQLLLPSPLTPPPPPLPPISLPPLPPQLPPPPPKNSNEDSPSQK